MGVEFRSLSEDFDTSTATGKLQLSMVLAFSEWWRNSITERSVAGQAKARTEGRFPGRRPSLTEQQREYIRVERSKGVSQRELSKRLEVSRWTIQQAGGRVVFGWKLLPLHGAWPVDSLTQYQRGQAPRQSSSTAGCWPTRAYQVDSGSERSKLRSRPGQIWRETDRPSNRRAAHRRRRCAGGAACAIGCAVKLDFVQKPVTINQ